MEKPLRLLVVGATFPPETFLEHLIRGLAQSGMEITVACPETTDRAWFSHPRISCLPTPGLNGSRALRLVRLGAMVIRSLRHGPHGMRELATLAGFSRGKPGMNLDGLRTWRRFLPFVGQSWDVVYFPWNTAAIAYLPLIDLCGCPGVVSCRGTQVNVAPHDPSRGAIIEGLNLTFRKAAAVHCVSEAMKTEAMQYGLSPTKAWVIRPAVDPDFFCPGAVKTPNKGAFQVITVGSLLWIKGYEYALAAVRRLLDQGIETHFHIIGDGPERPRLLYTIQDLALEGRVSLHGRLSPGEVRHKLQQADVFVLSSLSEGISNGLLEAMACGLPVVTTDCGGMREAVGEGAEGFVVPVREPEAMAAALSRLAVNPPLCRRLGEAARRRVVEHFSLHQHLEAFVRLFKHVALGDPSPR